MQPLAHHGGHADIVDGRKQADGDSRFAGRRFWLFGVRVTCPAEAKVALQDDLAKRRGERKRWSDEAWKATVKRARSQHVEISHGGKRVKKKEQLNLPAKISHEAAVGQTATAEVLVAQDEGPSPGKGATVPARPSTDTGRQSDQQVKSSAQVAEDMGLPGPAVPVGRSQPLATGPPDAADFGISAARTEETPASTQMAVPCVDIAKFGSHVLAAAPAWTRRFKIQRKIGEGTYGIVYAALLLPPWPSYFSTPSKAPPVIAIKVTRKKADDEDAMHSDRKEIQVLKSIGEHSHVVRLLAWRETHFNFQMFFKLYDCDLHTYIRRGGAAVADARLFCPQMLSAVCYIHSRGVLHRDIKPKNIFVHYQPLAVVLGDFGLSTALGDLSGGDTDPRLTPNVVTSWYRAPEVMLTPGLYSYPIDVWSLGVTIVKLERGQAPFRGHNDKDQLREIFTVFGTPSQESWPGLPGPTIERIHKVLATRCPLSPLAWPWGTRYGLAFKLFTQFFFSLDPARRSLAGAMDDTWGRPLVPRHLDVSRAT